MIIHLRVITTTVGVLHTYPFYICRILLPIVNSLDYITLILILFKKVILFHKFYRVSYSETCSGAKIAIWRGMWAGDGEGGYK